MNVADLIRILARRWLIVLGCTFGGLAVVWLLAFRFPTFQLKSATYCSTATVMMDSRTGGSSAAAMVTFIYARVLNDVEVVKSEVIAERASESLGGKYSTAEIMKTTSAENEFGTQTMDITACGDSPSDAVQVTNAVAEGYKVWTDERQDAVNVLGPNRVEITILTAPSEPSSPSGFPAPVWVTLGLIGGFIVGVVVAVGVESVQAGEETLPATQETGVRGFGNGESGRQHAGAGAGQPAQGSHYGNGNMTLPAVTAGRSRRPRRK